MKKICKHSGTPLSKRILAAFLASVTAFGFCACGQRSPIGKGSDTVITGEGSDTMITDNENIIVENLSVSELDTHVAGEKIRDRETREGSRIFINEENPLFLFRPSLPIIFGTDTLIATYEILPDDIKAFSALLYDPGANSTASVDELLKTYENILVETDEKDIPIFLVLERWNSVNTQEAFTVEQLCSLLENHHSLMGFAHLELSANPWSQEHAERIKTTIKACREYGAVFMWQDMGYQWENERNVLQRAFEDEELYELMCEYSHNVVLTDKHNGRGRHFSGQSDCMGAWLSGVCDNWGTNVESWLWWEVRDGDYANETLQYDGENYVHRYPPALGGIDFICDMVGGATVFSSEELFINYTTLAGVQLTETFWSVVYPLYQRILNGAIPDKEQVKEQIKVAYQFKSPFDPNRSGLESDMFIDTYGMTDQWYTLYNDTDSTRKWIPYTGRYYILPSLPKYADAAEVLPGVDVLNNKNYLKYFGSAEKKQDYLNERYPETYTGDATLYSINGLTYIFNNSEYTPKTETANYSLKTSGLGLSTELDLHAYMIVEDKDNGLDIELVNLRLDSEDVSTGKEMAYFFYSAYLNGEKMDNEADFRTTKIVLTGLERMPEVAISGNNGPTAEIKYDPAAKTATVTIVSNGRVLIEVTK